MAKQRGLPFGLAEAAHDERRNLLGLALLRVGCDLVLKEFVSWVFNATSGGTAGELRRTVAELAARPWGLCSSTATVRRAIKRAVALGLIRERPTVAASGGDGSNAYSIDWDGVSRCLDLRSFPGVERAAPRVGAPPVKLQAPPINLQGPPCNLIAPIKEYSETYPDETEEITRPPCAAHSSSGDDWTAAAAELRRVGADNADQLIAELRQTGRPPADALAIAATLAANAGRFRSPGGAAWCFVRTARWPVSSLVDPAAARETRRRRAERDAAADERRAVVEADRRRFADLLERYGPEVDALSAEELGSLAAAARVVGPLLETLRRDGWRASPLVAELILDAYAGAVR